MKTRLWQKPSIPSNNTVINPSTPQNSSFTPLQQQQYTPVSMQSSLLGNIPQQHLPNNYNVNTLFDRATAYQQNMQPSLSFSYNSQPPNMSSYSIANHQQGQFYTTNVRLIMIMILSIVFILLASRLSNKCLVYTTNNRSIFDNGKINILLYVKTIKRHFSSIYRLFLSIHYSE
jgi:hypothetical protein